jgi:predicted Na+-dependent transporter
MLFIFYFQENKEYLDVGIFVAVFVVLCILVILIVIKVGYLLFYRIKSDHHDITEILLKVVLHTLTLTQSLKLRYLTKSSKTWICSVKQ